MTLTDHGERAVSEALGAAEAAEPTPEQWRGVIPPFTDEPIDLNAAADEPVPYLPVYGDAAALRADLDATRRALRALRTELDGAQRSHQETMRRYVEAVEENIRLDGRRISAENRLRDERAALDRAIADRQAIAEALGMDREITHAHDDVLTEARRLFQAHMVGRGLLHEIGDAVDRAAEDYAQAAQ